MTSKETEFAAKTQALITKEAEATKAGARAKSGVAGADPAKLAKEADQAKKAVELARKEKLLAERELGNAKKLVEEEKAAFIKIASSHGATAGVGSTMELKHEH